jgi:outer membrane protein assembly factor BamB
MQFPLSRKITILFGILLVSGCSWFSSDEASKPAKLVSFKQTTKLVHQWSNHIGDQGDEELYIRLTPVMDGDVIYAATAKGKVMAISREKGNDLWNIKTHEFLISAVGAGEGLVFVGTANGVLIALQEDTGKEVWRAHLSSEMLSAAQVGDGVVVAQTIDGRVVGLERASGALRWQYNESVPPLTLRTSAAPLLDNGVAYIAFPSGKVVALDASNGLQLWEQQVTLPEGRTELERIIDFDGKPLLVGSDLYLADYQGRAVMLDKAKGTIQWSEKISTASQLAYGDGNLYVTQSDDTVVALKMATGRRLWENSQLARRQLTAPAVIGDYVAVADFDGYVHLLNQSDGQMAARYSLWRSKGVRNALLSNDKTLYVLSNRGRLTALELGK